MSKKEGDAADQGVGTPGFVERHGLHTDEQRASADAVAAEIREKGLRTVRVVIVLGDRRRTAGRGSLTIACRPPKPLRLKITTPIREGARLLGADDREVFC
jgi:hypothetical protein